MSKDSRFLSRILRHAPETIGLDLDSHGWASIQTLLSRMKAAGRHMTHARLIEIVETNDKKRFTISQNGRYIRAAQGHSIPVDLDLAEKTPPERLYHGTAVASLDAIFASGGLNSAKRQHVHLSPDPETAIKVGRRHGRPVVLRVSSGLMHNQGFIFYRADNGVWLTDHVPRDFLSFI